MPTRKLLAIAAGVALFVTMAFAVPPLATAAPGDRGTPSAPSHRLPPTPTGPMTNLADAEPTSAQRARLTAAERQGLVTRTVATSEGFAPGQLAELRTSGVQVMATGCTWFQWTVTGLNVAGASVWRYAMRIDWCFAGSRVVSISPPQIRGHVYAWAAALGWSYRGVQSQAQWDFFGDGWVYRNFSQGKFELCPPRFWCIQTRYPWIYIDSYGNGVARVPAWSH
jgi:hypothetical protein